MLSEAGELTEKRLGTEPARLVEVFKQRPRAKIPKEASTISEWLARPLEELGHEVVAALRNRDEMKPAELLLLNDNPLTDISKTAGIVGVVMRGQ